MSQTCSQCNKHGDSFPRCTRCWVTRYCSRDCQRRHWPRHKAMCVTKEKASALATQEAETCDKDGSSSRDKRRGESSVDPPDTAAAAQETMDTCKKCKTKTSTSEKCGRCLAVTYCSHDCRRADWKSHEATCKPVAGTGDENGQNHQTGEEEDSVPGEGTGATAERQQGDAGADERQPSLSAPTDLSPEEGEDVQTCQACKTKKWNMKKCGRCHEVTYCSRDCQRADWRTHKVTCTPIETLTTDGYRETERKERRERENHMSAANLLASLMRGHFTSGGDLTWQEARARAGRLFPLHRVVDDFDHPRRDFDLFNPFAFPSFASQNVVAVFRLTTPYFHPFRPARNVADADGRTLHVIFYTSTAPWPFFSFQQLREGNFICIQDPCLHGFADGTVGFRVDDPSEVRILEP